MLLFWLAGECRFSMTSWFLKAVQSSCCHRGCDLLLQFEWKMWPYRPLCLNPRVQGSQLVSLFWKAVEPLENGAGCMILTPYEIQSNPVLCFLLHRDMRGCQSLPMSWTLPHLPCCGGLKPKAKINSSCLSHFYFILFYLSCLSNEKSNLTYLTWSGTSEMFLTRTQKQKGEPRPSLPLPYFPLASTLCSTHSAQLPCDLGVTLRYFNCAFPSAMKWKKYLFFHFIWLIRVFLTQSNCLPLPIWSTSICHLLYMHSRDIA